MRVGIQINNSHRPPRYKAIEARIEQLLDAAAAMGVNIACLQEVGHVIDVLCPFIFVF